MCHTVRQRDLEDSNSSSHVASNASSISISSYLYPLEGRIFLRRYPVPLQFAQQSTRKLCALYLCCSLQNPRLSYSWHWQLWIGYAQFQSSMRYWLLESCNRKIGIQHLHASLGTLSLICKVLDCTAINWPFFTGDSHDNCRRHHRNITLD